mmetsp:Transcript_31474/g.90229  ORF Transcript_31474/g.90229 Transcript_31474/m.90229 type:complete len:619 (-) Transcript_31474:60-1916(-)
MAVGLDNKSPSYEPLVHLDQLSPVNALAVPLALDAASPRAPTPLQPGAARGAAWAAKAAEAPSAALLAALDELRRLLAEEREQRSSSFQRLERRVEQLRGEGQVAAAEGHDALRGEKQRLERMQAEMVWMGAALQGVREQLGMACDSASPSSDCNADPWWDLAAKRINSMDERQSVLDDRLKALRVEFREIVAQEAEQRVDGLQRLERAQRTLSSAEGTKAAAPWLERLQLQHQQTELAVTASCQGLAERLEAIEMKSAQHSRLSSDRIAKMEDQTAAHAKLTDAVQLRVEELARAHNSVARATRGAQPEVERRVTGLDAAFGNLRSDLQERLARLEEQLQVQARIADERNVCIEELARSQQSATWAAHAEAEVDKRLVALDRAVGALRTGFEEHFAKLGEQAKAQAKATEATQTRLEDLAHAHNSVARVARDAQPEIDRRLSAISENVASLQSEVAKDREHMSSLGKQLTQWEQRFEAFGARIDAHCTSLQNEAERADSECRHESQKRKDTESLLVSLLGELDIIRMQIDHRSGPGLVGNRCGTHRYATDRPREPCATALAVEGEGQEWSEALLPEAALGAPYLRAFASEDPALSPPRPMHLFANSVLHGSPYGAPL